MSNVSAERGPISVLILDEDTVILTLAKDNRIAWQLDERPPWARIPPEQVTTVKRLLVAAYSLRGDLPHADANDAYQSMCEAIKTRSVA